MLVLTLTEQQGQELAVIFDLALKAGGMRILQQVHPLATILQQSFDLIEKDKKESKEESKVDSPKAEEKV